MWLARRSNLLLFLVIVFVIGLPGQWWRGLAWAQEDPFPVPAGLEDAVEFWKLVFTRYGASEVIFHDPLEPTKIYEVIEASETPAGRSLVEEERSKIMAGQGFQPEDKRVRAQRGVKERFLNGLKLSGKYLDQMKSIFKEEGLPPDLAYLPLVESSFNIHARSSVGAVGMWQFMPSTGKKFLTVSRTLDERRDPLESTRAAARFLKQNYHVFGNWPLALTAYNHGREGMLRAVNEVGSNDITEIIRRYQGPAFGFASKSFYAEFLAAVDIAKRSEEYFPDLQLHPPVNFEELQVRRSISIAALLKPTDTERKEFLEWNPALHPKIRDIPGGYRVKFPADKRELFMSAYRKLIGVFSPTPAVAAVKEKETKVSWTRHRVAPGETLAQISKKYQVPVREIQRANGLGHSNIITAGKDIKIPSR